jgi:glutamate--cysteine ligase
MMKGTCSVQANFDYADEADCARKFEVAQALSPLNTAIFANSPVAEGKDTGFVSYRGFVWTRTDPSRTGFPETVRAGYSHDRWVDYLLDTPMMFVKPRGAWISANGRTFREWMAEGIDGVFPGLHDWALHQTSVFPEVRVKKTIEIRGADAVDVALAVGFCALWTGVLYGPGALSAALGLARAFVATDEPHEARHLESARNGMGGTMSGRPTAEWARQLGMIARLGLLEIGEDARLLDPVLELLESGRSPGVAVKEAFEADPSPANVLGVLRY